MSSLVTGMALYFRTPFPEDNIFCGSWPFALRRPFSSPSTPTPLFLDTTPYIAYSILLSGIYIFALKAGRKIRAGKLPLYPNPRKRAVLSLWVGGAHHARNQIPAQTPPSLATPHRPH